MSTNSFGAGSRAEVVWLKGTAHRTVSLEDRGGCRSSGQRKWLTSWRLLASPRRLCTTVGGSGSKEVEKDESWTSRSKALHWRPWVYFGFRLAWGLAWLVT